MFASLNRSIGRLARGGSSSGKPSSANPHYDGYSQFGVRSASNMRYNIAKNKQNEMMKNEAAEKAGYAAFRQSRANKVRNAKFNADFNAMKQSSPIHGALSKRQWKI